MVMALSTKLPWELAQPRWAAELNPFLALPILSGNQIENIILVANVPKAINHLLMKIPQGWFLVDKTSDATIWRSAIFTNTTITLTASANTTIDLYIF
jgi:hypothetical protein